MSAIKKLLAAQNELINPVFKAMTDDGANKCVSKLEDAQREAALMVGGILIGVKVSIMQAAKLIEDMQLDDVIE